MIRIINRLARVKLESLVILFFVFLTLFPTLRILTIGTETSTNFYELFISILPELFFSLIIVKVAVSIIKNGVPIRFNIIDYSVLSFFILNLVVGAILSNNFKLSLYAFRMTYLPIVFYFIIRIADIKKEEFDKVLHTIFNWFTVIGIIGILLYFVFKDSMMYMLNLVDKDHIPAYFIIRMSSILWTPVCFGTLMSLSTLYWLNECTKEKRWIVFTKFAIVLFCLIFSVSRGAILATVVGMGMLFVYYFNQNRVLFGSILVVIILVYLGASFYIADPFIFTKWFIHTSSETASMGTNMVRVKFWNSSYSLFLDRPYGYGLGRAGHIAARFFSPDSKEAAFYSTDGWFLKLLCENGIQGLVLYIFFSISFIYYCLANLIKNVDVNDKDRVYFFFVFFISINFQNMVSNVLDFYMINYFFWMVIGFASSQIYHKKTIA